MISVQNISKTFKLYRKPSERLKEILFRQCRHKKFDAVKDLSFMVPSGKTLGLIGENGAGKSTVLKLLTGVLIPDTGTVHISGKITGLLELGTGFNHEFSGIDNIIHNATYLGLSRPEINRKLDQIIAFTELGDFIHEPLKTYSSGMIMRLAFSVAIHAEPQAFVVDEALSVGDAYFQQKCMQKIREFKAGGGSIVFVSHDMNAVKVLCDEAILLDHGTAIAYGEPETIINAYNRHIARRSISDDDVRAGPSLNGYGSRQVLIESVTLKDEHHNETKILISGKPADIVITLKGQASMEDLTLGIVIRDRFGQDVYGTNSHYLKKKINVQQGRTMDIVYSFDQFNLGPGKYSITAAIHTGASHVDQCVHWVDGCAVFETVLGDEPFFAGLIRLTPKLHVNGG
ncbi:MAG TPA: ABC transporter ATP-binding protein [Desulfobacter sp.]|jgi:lipopolysaccharide transport system ATP-binding protein|uniref:ABC transporter ATP-binding protein n=1 Tax=Desulfobacter sp. UBA2225 TaxID=1961413 RepID=UPI000E9B8281|nr:ABC transporter ATP-binding protein [Desulfobacter sp. UBA2225]MDQ1269988.1 lipopolysaccharide transport system ATP-binding protein [Thermodesulfobacteriota bacterium]HAR34481.1 ABC transporter ATP-binding protein [Desulfobacter sp.]